MDLSQQQLSEIRHLLATGQRVRAAKRLCELAGCDLSAAVAELDALCDSGVRVNAAAISVTPQDPEEPTPSGSRWTLVMAICVFVAILATVYLYLFPRLKGERVSSESSLRFFVIASNETEGLQTLVLPDGSSVSAEDDAVLVAGDFSVFRGDGLQSPARLTLYFSDSGQKRARQFIGQDVLELAVTLNGRAIARTRPSEWTETNALILLPNLSESDVNEIFARLTQ